MPVLVAMFAPNKHLSEVNAPPTLALMENNPTKSLALTFAGVAIVPLAFLKVITAP